MGDWRVVVDGANAFFRSASFGASAVFVQAIAVLPRMGEIGTGVDIRDDGVTVKLITQTCSGPAAYRDAAAGDWWTHLRAVSISSPN